MLRGGAMALLMLLTAGLLPQMKQSVSTTIGLVPVVVGTRTIAAMPFEVTVAQWQACEAAGACATIAPAVPEPGRTPMTGVNWFDIEAFARWYNGAHQDPLRLPTAEEWRIISRTSEPLPEKPRFSDPRLAWAANYGQEAAPRGPVRPQGSWSRTQDGVYEMEGNVWEWTLTCASNGIQDMSRCPAVKVMGAHTATLPVFVRNPAAGGCATGRPPAHVGFRLVRDL